MHAFWSCNAAALVGIVIGIALFPSQSLANENTECAPEITSFQNAAGDAARVNLINCLLRVDSGLEVDGQHVVYNPSDGQATALRLDSIPEIDASRAYRITLSEPISVSLETKNAWFDYTTGGSAATSNFGAPSTHSSTWVGVEFGPPENHGTVYSCAFDPELGSCGADVFVMAQPDRMDALAQFCRSYLNDPEPLNTAVLGDFWGQPDGLAKYIAQDAPLNPMLGIKDGNSIGGVINRIPLSDFDAATLDMMKSSGSVVEFGYPGMRVFSGGGLGLE